jgi:hypothetical protein
MSDMVHGLRSLKTLNIGRNEIPVDKRKNGGRCLPPFEISAEFSELKAD